MSPGRYPRRILLVTTGLSPQVVTETLYALSRASEPFVPTEIHVVTTVEGAKRARLSLLSQNPGWFARLCEDYGLSNIQFDDASIHVLCTKDGFELEDIRSETDNASAADGFAEIVRKLTSDDQSALHVSLAGGRKTMGYYMGYALSLFGREQDRLSHVLVSEPFESSWDFFYPTPYEHIIKTSGQQLANAADARVTLAQIPFVRLRDGLPARLQEGQASFNEVIEAANRAHATPLLRLNAKRRQVWADEQAVSLSPAEFALLYHLAKRVLMSDAGDRFMNWADAGEADGYLRSVAYLYGMHSADYERTERALHLCGDDDKNRRKYFEPHNSNINAAFAKALNVKAALRYQTLRVGARGQSRYGLNLSASEILIEEL